jgi:hypothetical protein
MEFALKSLKGKNMRRKSIIQGISICVALILVILTYGCVGPTIRTYSGDKLQKSEVAVIKGRYYFTPLNYVCVDIQSVDDSILKATKVEVLPGWHELVIKHYIINLFGSPPEFAQVTFNFEAGHEYKIKTHFNHNVDIMDVTTDAIILTEHFSPLTSYPRISFVAGIQPLPENHGRWSREEIDTVIEAIATTAKHHGFKQRKQIVVFETSGFENEYTLSGKHSVFTLTACYLYDDHGLRKKFRLTSKSPKTKGTIYLMIECISSLRSLTASDRLLVEKIWHEVLDPLRNKFGERMEEGSYIQIYKLEP